MSSTTPRWDSRTESFHDIISITFPSGLSLAAAISFAFDPTSTIEENFPAQVDICELDELCPNNFHLFSSLPSFATGGTGASIILPGHNLSRLDETKDRTASEMDIHSADLLASFKFGDAVSTSFPRVSRYPKESGPPNPDASPVEWIGSPQSGDEPPPPLSRLPFLPLDLILQHLSLLDIFHLGQAVPAVKSYTSTIASSRLRVTLSPYFSDLTAFDNVLCRTGSVLSGSAVLHVIQPGNWSPGDINLVVPKLGHPRVRKFLLEEGYTAVERPEGPTTVPRYEDLEFRQFMHHRYTKGTRSVDVSETWRTSVVDFVLSYHSSVVMNYYTTRTGKLFCLFPALTFNVRYKKNNFPVTTHITAARAKYNARGYREAWPSFLQDNRVMPVGANLAGDEPGMWLLNRGDLLEQSFRVAAEL